MMKTLTTKPILRLGVFLTVLFNVVFNVFYDRFFPNIRTVEEISKTHFSFFTPAPYTFMIWGVIYITFITYGVYQLLLVTRDLKILNRLAWPMIVSNMLCSIWIILFSLNRIIESLVIILVILALAIVLFKRAEKYRFSHPWLVIPFSIFFGWISVAAIANFTTWLASMNWDGGYLSLSLWTIIMIVIAFAAAVIMSIRFQNILYPLVIAWALMGIWIVNRYVNPFVAYAAMISLVVLLSWLGAYFYLKAFKKSKIIQQEHSNQI